MSSLIEHDSNEGDVVRISDANQDTVSLKTYQDIYHQITGMTEEIRKRYKDSTFIEKSDIKQLHIKITQLFDVHNVIASNETIIVYYDKDRKDQFTSFEKFETFNSSSNSPVTNLVFKYNVSIIPAKLKQPQEYTITIRLTSRIAQVKELREDAPTLVHGPLASLLVRETAEIRIEYVDYIIARGFLEAFDEWMSGTKKVNESKFVSLSKRYSHFIPAIGKLVIAFLYGIFIYLSIDNILGPQPNIPTLAKFLIISLVAFYLAVSFSRFVLSSIERSIDSQCNLSWIKLTKGDENLIAEEESRKSRNIWVLLFNSSITIILGVVSTQVSKIIEKLT